MIEAVVFDLDGVLIETEELWDEVREALAREVGARYDAAAQRTMMGMSAPEWSAFMESLGVPGPPAAINDEVVRRLIARYRAQLPRIPGAVAAVERMAAAGYTLAVASSSNRVLIELVLELSGIPSLAFAVGVYLPLSSSTPILAGGVVRWLVDRHRARAPEVARMTAEQQAADSDKSPGVLLASGYIAGGAIAGIVIAFVAGVLGDVDSALTHWAEASNPAFAGPWSDALAMVPFVLAAAWLWRVGVRKAT